MEPRRWCVIHPHSLSLANRYTDSDYTIFMWRQKSAAPASDQSPVLHVRNPDEPLPTPPAYRNLSFYVFQAKRAGPSSPPLSTKESAKSDKKARKASLAEKAKNDPPKHKKEFEKFHSENGVRTISGGIGPVKNGE